MKQENIFIAHPKNKEEISVLKAFMKALNIKFEIAKDNPYKSEFVEKILQGKKDIEQGKGVRFSIEELNNLCK